MLFAETSPEIRCALAEGGKRMLSRQTILHMGKWPHPKAPGGVLDIDEKRLDEIVKNFRAGVGLAGDEMPAHIGHTEHVDDRAVAWAKIEKVADEKRPGMHKLVAISEHTDPRAFADIKNKSYRFVSPTLVFGYRDRTTGKTHDTVLRNYAYTNYPFLQGMGDAEVVNMSEVQLAELSDLGVGEDVVTLADGLDWSLNHSAILKHLSKGNDGTGPKSMYARYDDDGPDTHENKRGHLIRAAVGESPTKDMRGEANDAVDSLVSKGHIKKLPGERFQITDSGTKTLAGIKKNMSPQYYAALADGGVPDASGGGAQGDPNPAGLPKGYDMQSLPSQCMTCARLGNDCPFAAADAPADVALKQAAAQSGNCPQYVESDGNQPGGGGSKDAETSSPADNRGTVPMGEQSRTIALADGSTRPFDDVDHHILKTLVKHGPVSGSRLTQVVRHRMAEPYSISDDWGDDKHSVGPRLSGMVKSGHVAEVESTPLQKKSGEGTFYEATPKGKQTLIDHIKADPMNAVKLSDNRGPVPMSDSSDGGLQDTHMHILKAVMKHGSPVLPISHVIDHVTATTGLGGAGKIADFTRGLADDGYLNVHAATKSGPVGYSATDKGRRALIAHIKADPMNAVKLSDSKSTSSRKVNNMPTKSIDALRQRLAQVDAEEQTRFVTSLGEKHGLPADALKSVDALFKTGTATAVQMGEAIDAFGTTLALAEPGEAVDMPAALADVDMGEMVMVSKVALRDLVEAVASSGRTEVQLGDTAPVEGKPEDGKPKTTTQKLSDMDDPRAAVKELERLQAEGKVKPQRG